MGILFLVNYRKVYVIIFLWLDLGNCIRGEDFVSYWNFSCRYLYYYIK